MKKNTYTIVIIILLFGTPFFQKAIVFAQPHTINYTIGAWNVSGSYTINIGTVLNTGTNHVEGYMRITFPDSEVVEVTPQVINSFIQELENNQAQMFSGTAMSIKDPNMIVIELDKLRAVKSLLEDETRMEAFINQFQNNLSEFNWDYTLQTIRSIQIQVTGTVN